uniref:Uncharacterized protein n=1 Tax=Avena sativa TaxID=4498 RepID=A0ACD5ZZF7_AVESA
MADRKLIHWLLAVSLLSSLVAHAQLSTTFYSTSCPNLETTVWEVMKEAVTKDRRIGASLLRLFFHDCFVQGCDGSILLDAGGEKSAGPNANSLRGFDAIDTIKASVEAACPGVVSCADILALAARDGTFLLRGPTWKVPLGRRDSTTANQSLANANLPSSGASLATLISTFASQGLSPTDMTALSGAHTIGLARCSTFRDRIYNDAANMDTSFAAQQRKACPQSGNDGHLAPMDVQSPREFDTAYYDNLMARRGLLHSDQELFNGGSQDALVRQYSASPALFRSDFVKAMVKMGNINPLTGTAGQIRKNCRLVNS